MSRLFKWWHEQRAWKLKKKLHTLDPFRDDEKMHNLRSKRIKHLVAADATDGYINVKQFGQGNIYSRGVDDEEDMTHVVPTYYEYDTDGQPTGSTVENSDSTPEQDNDFFKALDAEGQRLAEEEWINHS